jgi:pimeloyl-ACP methyl ester carboxylesterase
MDRRQTTGVGGAVPTAATTGAVAREVTQATETDCSEMLLENTLSERGQQPPDLAEQTRAVIVHRTPEPHVRMAALLQGYGVSCDLASIRVPTLQIYGDDDRLTPVEHGHAVWAAIPGARPQISAGIRHGLLVEAKEHTAQSIREFVRAHRLVAPALEDRRA